MPRDLLAAVPWWAWLVAAWALGAPVFWVLVHGGARADIQVQGAEVLDLDAARARRTRRAS